MKLVDQVGPELVPFLDWLLEQGDWSLREVLDVLEDPVAWQPEFEQWQRETSPAPTLAELEGERRAARS